jgi:hypothetical protein
LKFAYIVSLPHSGSTILSYNLSEHPNIVFLGEVGYALKKLHESRNQDAPVQCSCGKAAAQCDFWRSVLERLPARFDEQAGYEIVIEEFQKKFGDSKLLLDSNKTVEPLYFLRTRPGLEIRGIHTTRDFRGAVVSEARRKKKKRPDRAEWITAIQAGFQWMRKNRAIQRSFGELNLDGMCRTSYEKLCKNPAGEVEAIWRFLGMTPRSFEGLASAQNAHLLVGNSLKSSGGTRTPTYDTRWKSSWIWWPCVLLMPILPLLNRRWVYGRD